MLAFDRMVYDLYGLTAEDNFVRRNLRALSRFLRFVSLMLIAILPPHKNPHRNPETTPAPARRPRPSETPSALARKNLLRLCEKFLLRFFCVQFKLVLG